MSEIDWSQCPDVESVPGRCSGARVAKESRVMVGGIFHNAAVGCSAAEIAEMFTLPLDQVQRILDFALAHPPLLTSSQAISRKKRLQFPSAARHRLVP